MAVTTTLRVQSGDELEDAQVKAKLRPRSRAGRSPEPPAPSPSLVAGRAGLGQHGRRYQAKADQPRRMPPTTAILLGLGGATVRARMGGLGVRNPWHSQPASLRVDDGEHHRQPSCPRRRLSAILYGAWAGATMPPRVKAIVSAVAFVCVACGSTQASSSASTATPTSSPTAVPAPVSLSGTGRETTTSFTLPNGHLVFNFTGSSACGYAIFLVDPLNRPSDWAADGNGNHQLQDGEQQDLLGVLAGTYQLAVDAVPNPGLAGVPCGWTFTFTPVR
jgi:hypothetical protein